MSFYPLGVLFAIIPAEKIGELGDGEIVGTCILRLSVLSVQNKL